MGSNENSLPLLDDRVATDLHVAVERTLGQMFGLKVEFKYDCHDGVETLAHGDVYGSVGLIHEKFLGSLVIAFPEATLLKILKLFYKRDFSTIDQVAADAVAELTNIIFCVFKHRLNEKGFYFAMAIPQVMVGKSQRVPNSSWTLHGRVTTPVGNLHAYIVRAERTPG